MRKYLFPFLSVFSVVLTCTSVPDPVSAPPEYWPVTVYTEVEHPFDAYYELTVSGEGVLTLRINTITVGDCIMVNVPAGKARLFQCRRYVQNVTMDLTDTGSVVADVKEGLNTVVCKLSPIPVPVITSQPQNYSLTCNGYAWFAVTAEGLSCSYEWQKNGNSFSWQGNSSTYSGYVDRSDSGSIYRCIVCNASGCDTSSEAVLSVLPDTVPPEIFMLDSTVEVYLDSAYEDNSVFAFDSFNVDLTDSITRTGTVNTAEAGTYTVTYSVADSSGNIATATRTVIVRPITEEDLSRPVIILTGPEVFDLNIGISTDAFRDSGIYAYDREDGDITGKATVSKWIQVHPSVWYCSYNVTDSNGNAAKTRYRYTRYWWFGPIIVPIPEVIGSAIPEKRR